MFCLAHGLVFHRKSLERRNVNMNDTRCVPCKNKESYTKCILYQLKDYDVSRSVIIHHDCPCRIQNSHPKGRNFNQRRSSLVEFLSRE